MAAAVAMLELARALDDLTGRNVIDLGSGTGRLAIGAALFGARAVVGVEVDPEALAVARIAAAPWKTQVRFRRGPVESLKRGGDTVLMNPPFGAQRRGADRPFWEGAFRLARRRVYAFALADSRTFILKHAVAAHAYVEAARPVPWELPRLFSHHRHDRVSLKVDLWVIRTERAT